MLDQTRTSAERDYNAACEFPEFERYRSGRFHNGPGPDGGHHPDLLNTEILISKAIRAKDGCAMAYFRGKLWHGIAYMHKDSAPPAEYRAQWAADRAAEVAGGV